MIVVIDIASFSKTEQISTAERRGASTVHCIHVGDGDVAGSGNADDADDPIVSSSSSSYWERTTKQKKKDILQQHMVCVKNKCGPEGSRECNIHHANAKKALSQTFGAAKHFVPKKLDGESKSTKYTNIQSDYVGNLAKIKLLEAHIMAYDMKYSFIITTLLYEYAGAFKDRWGNRAARGVYLSS